MVRAYELGQDGGINGRTSRRCGVRRFGPVDLGLSLTTNIPQIHPHLSTDPPDDDEKEYSTKARMVGRLHDTRLLENLVKCEKEYQVALAGLLALSHSSVAALSAYGAALNPSCSRAVLAVSSVLTSADDSLRGYADSIDDWREKLAAIRTLDGDIEIALRDREILVTRLIKVSKQRPKGSSIASTSSTGTKLAVAQSELQACEVHLADKQRELDEVIRSAVIDGLERRCKGLVDCGAVWSSKGQEGLAALDELRSIPPVPNGDTHPYPPFAPRHLYSRPRDGNSIDSHTSLAPSQSASQIGINTFVTPRPSEDTHITAVGSSNTYGSQPIKPPSMPSPSLEPYRLNIPPAHSIDDHVLPSGSSRPDRLVEEPDEVELNSSSEEDDTQRLEVHENPARTPAPFSAPPIPNGDPGREDTLSPPKRSYEPPPTLARIEPSQSITRHLRKPPTTGPRVPPPEADEDRTPGRKRSSSFSLFGSIAGLFHTKSKSSVASGSKASRSPTKIRHPLRDMERDASPVRKPQPSTSSGWQTRTDRNLKEGRSEMVVGSGAAAADSSSDEDEGKGKKKSRFGFRRKEQPEVETSNGMMTRRLKAEGAGVRRQRTVDEGPPREDTRRLSRHSSDGALHSRSNSLSKATTGKGTQDDSHIHREIPTVSTFLHKFQPSSPSAPTAPVTAPQESSPKPSPRSASPAKGKIRKRAPGKHFDDGLGSSGGALVVGPTSANAGTKQGGQRTASGNMVLGGTGGGLSRGNTVRSAVGHPSRSQPSTPVNPSFRRSSLQHDGLMASSSASRAASPASPPAHKEEATLSRSDSMGSRTTSRSRGPSKNNNLMSIVEGGRATQPAKLEVVKAPGSLTSPSMTGLYLPNASSPSSHPLPPLPSENRIQSASTTRLTLPSEVTRERDPMPVASSSKANGSTSNGNIPMASRSTTALHEPAPAAPTGNGHIVSRNSSIRSNGTPSALMPPPLRSALRNRSPSPAMFTSPPPQSHPPLPTSSQTQPSPPTTSPQPNGPPPPVPSKSPNRPSPTQLQMALAAAKDNDSSSISSYETGHETFEDASDVPTVRGESSTHLPGNGLAGFMPPPPPPDSEKKGTDLSISTETDSTSQPQRRKSVRMALPPSVSSTPAATPAAVTENEKGWPYEHDATPKRRSQVFAERDIWAEEDSDAGGEYQSARKALAKATKALSTAGDLTKKKHHTHH